MKNILIYIIPVFSLLLINSGVYSQSPVIKNVTVINDEGHVRLDWEYTGTDNLIILRDKASVLEVIQTIDHNTTSFIDNTAQAHIKPRLYMIQTESNPGSYYSDIVTTFHLTFNYDSCLQQIQLNWEKLSIPENNIYSDWIPNNFIINIIKDDVLQTTTIDASNTEYTISNIESNTNYKIFIETRWQGQDSTSYSNPINKFTQMPLPPEYINSISASANGNNTDVKFEIATNSNLDTYKFLKSDSHDGFFDTLETFISSEYEITLTDYDSDPESKINFYKLVSVDICGNDATESDIINNIVLQVENEEYDNTLNWNRFKDYDFVVTNYEIYRFFDDNEPELIHEIDFNYFPDNIEQVLGDRVSGKVCYFIRALAQGANVNDYSQSNTACIYLKPKIYIPEAFTPNEDGKNDEFKPVLSFIPIDYELKIYNRWGNIIYTTNIFSESWKGKESSGKPASTGTYIYYLKIKTPDNQIIEERGNITVFYP